MYAVAMLGILVGLMALLGSVFLGEGASPVDIRTQSVATNYAVAQNAVQEAVHRGLAVAPTLPAGESFIAGSECKTPLTTATQCALLLDASISPDVAAHLPQGWKVMVQAASPAVPRWKGGIMGGFAFVYGAVSLAEMAALRSHYGNTATLSLCKGGDDGAACLPPVQQYLPDGSLAAVHLPLDISTAPASEAFAVHVVQLIR